MAVGMLRRARGSRSSEHNIERRGDAAVTTPKPRTQSHTAQTPLCDGIRVPGC